MKEKIKPFSFERILNSLLIAAILAVAGFFVDFQLFKSRVSAVERKVKLIGEVKELQCEIAIYLFKDNKKVLKHCK